MHPTDSQYLPANNENCMQIPFFSQSRISTIAREVPFEELKKRIKIVVVDDEEDSFPVSELKDNGYTIEWWPSLDGNRLQRLEAGAFDIIVLDIQGITTAALSDTGDGRGVLRRIKDVNPRQIVVAFSGKTYDLQSMQFYKLADETLSKPVSLVKCKEVLDHLIQAKISIGHYWTSVEELLRKEGVAEKKIRKLEDLVVKTTKENRPLTMDRLKEVVGNIDTGATIASLIQQIYALWRAISS